KAAKACLYFLKEALGTAQCLARQVPLGVGDIQHELDVGCHAVELGFQHDRSISHQEPRDRTSGRTADMRGGGASSRDCEPLGLTTVMDCVWAGAPVRLATPGL